MEKRILEDILNVLIAGQKYMWDSNTAGIITDEELYKMNKEFVALKNIIKSQIQIKKYEKWEELKRKHLPASLFFILTETVCLCFYMFSVSYTFSV